MYDITPSDITLIVLFSTNNNYRMAVIFKSNIQPGFYTCDVLKLDQKFNPAYDTG